jgi:hypothetical protein
LLLFEVEPLIAKAILPWFGGSAQVWTSCLLFFQAMLLAGYFYAHLLSTRVAPAWQWRIHAALLVASLIFLPIIPAEHWKPLGGENPLWLILGLLTSTIGLPFLLLSATSPLLQAWLARPVDGVTRSPYRLFALSNFGSMVALLGYPILIEPYLSGRVQAISWSVLYAGFAGLCGYTGWRYRHGEAVVRIKVASPPLARRWLWFLLAAIPSGLLLAMTNFMLQNVAAIPLFWIVPLALYLISFVIAFNNLKWFTLPEWYVLFSVAIGGVVIAFSGEASDLGLYLLPLLAGCLFVFCCVCHGELSLLKPEPQHLTEYYLIIAAGGAAGGLFVAALAPNLFNAPYELTILMPLMVLAVALAGAQHYREWAQLRPGWLLLAATALFTATAAIMGQTSYASATDAVLLSRNFYASLRVQDSYMSPSDPIPARRLVNGTIMHGLELMDAGLRREPMSYYARVSGIGLTLGELGREGPLKVGVIGLGVGTLAAYGRAGDEFRFYEINPAVETIARREFYYLATNPARQEVILGDARLSLERERPQRFDVLVVDAFTSDAIPMHLLTREAFALYDRHLKANGVLAVHISNRFVDLAPIVGLAAAAEHKAAVIIDNDNDFDHAVARSVWVLVSRRPGLFDAQVFRGHRPVVVPPDVRPWTDDYSSIWPILRY